MSDVQHPSWFDPKGYFKGEKLEYPEGWLVSQIYFPTNKSELDDQDKEALNLLYKVYSVGLLGPKRQKFVFIGNADHRGKKKYNRWLALNRATSVKTYIDRKVGQASSYISQAYSRGEKNARYTWMPMEMAMDRRVDVFAPYRVQTHIKIPPFFIQGKYTGKLSTKFKFRMLAGGGGGKGGGGAQIFSMEIKNSRTGKSLFYTYTGGGIGVSFGLKTPSKWQEKVVRDDFGGGKPVWMDVEDFEGPGRVVSFSVIYGKMHCSWEGPKDRGRSKKLVGVEFKGWDLEVGGGADIEGYWHIR